MNRTTGSWHRWAALAIAASLVVATFIIIPAARACTDDAGFSLLDGELPGGG